MSKKNKDIEIKVNEKEIMLDGQKVSATELFAGKKQIGEIREIKGFQAYAEGTLLGNFKKIDDAFEAVIANYNLHQ